jgi:hypothetical protein
MCHFLTEGSGRVSNTVVRSIAVDHALDARVIAAAKQHRISISALTREALARYLASLDQVGA